MSPTVPESISKDTGQTKMLLLLYSHNTALCPNQTYRGNGCCLTTKQAISTEAGISSVLTLCMGTNHQILVRKLSPIGQSLLQTPVLNPRLLWLCFQWAIRQPWGWICARVAYRTQGNISTHCLNCRTSHRGHRCGDAQDKADGKEQWASGPPWGWGMGVDHSSALILTWFDLGLMSILKLARSCWPVSHFINT